MSDFNVDYTIIILIIVLVIAFKFFKGLAFTVIKVVIYILLAYLAVSYFNIL